ncbi:MAG: archease [Candidatus Pacebacteria bacterium]|nr:archease [Candidatus Paceibacterota bacterium]
MKNYETLEHPSDLKIKAFGKTKEELFLYAMLAMEESLEPEIIKKEKIKREIKIKSLDFQSLLVDFLSEILYKNQIEKEAYNSIKFKILTDMILEAEVSGEKVERFGEDIKAVTYHDLDVHQEKDGSWQATILFDV